ncbi:MAG: hypothetical protein WC788_05760 [Candidatus Paceibacterota bacterium]|jgi:hypothetical protein
MPYVPSKKTDHRSKDREILDAAVEGLAREAADEITNNLSLIKVYGNIFFRVADELAYLLKGGEVSQDHSSRLAKAIFEVGEGYEYEGAYLGEFNYAITRLIQRVPQIKVEHKEWNQEFRYWLYAVTVEALIRASTYAQSLNIGISGVFEDIKDEYKRRVNTAYEAEQIIKSGDCYDAPYYTKLVKVLDDEGKFVGYQEIMLKRDRETLGKDLLSSCVVLEKV